MSWHISHEDYRSGNGCLYTGKVEIVRGNFYIAKNKARYLQMKVNTTSGTEKKKWVEEYTIKDETLISKAKKLTFNSNAYFNLKIQEILNQMKSKPEHIVSSKEKKSNEIQINHVQKKTSKELLYENTKKYGKTFYGRM